MGSQTTPGFPTLAEQLADRPPYREPPFESLVALLEGAGVDAAVLDVLPAEVGRGADRRAAAPTICSTSSEATRETCFSFPSRSDSHCAILAGLRAALAGDSACTTVSFDEGSRPVVAGVPPPAIDHPRAGVVLVRRIDLLLAWDEADLTGGFVAGSPAETGGGPDRLRAPRVARAARIRPPQLRRRRAAGRRRRHPCRPAHTADARAPPSFSTEAASHIL